MADYTLAYSEYKKVVQHALGKTPDTSITSYSDLINDGIQYVVNKHPWRWRRRYMSLTSVTNTNALTVSGITADFSGVHSLFEGPGFDAVAPILKREIFPIFANVAVPNMSTLRYQVLGIDQSGLTAASTFGISIFPAPSAGAAHYVQGFYLVRVPKIGANDTDLINAPPEFTVLFKKAIRAWSMVEDGSDGAQSEWGAFQDMLNSYIESDINADRGIPPQAASRATAA